MKRLEVRAKFFFEGDKKIHLQGVSYGPFRPPTSEAPPFPTQEKVEQDLSMMVELGFNTLRVYHSPPSWFLDLVGEKGLRVLITIPWYKRVLFLDEPEVLRATRQNVAEIVQAHAGHPALMGYFLDNEIPTDLVRWYGARRIEQYLDSLVSIVKKYDPTALTSYANFPPTEYLLPRAVDFLSYNIYLHDPHQLRQYLARLQNLSGDKPLLLSEFGMDTLRHSQEEQATLLEAHLQVVFESGLAGTLLFSWTDEWYTNGVDVEDWAFGLVTRERQPKLCCQQLAPWLQNPSRPLFERFPLPQEPRVSVVVCSYNGAHTLRDCLESLQKLHYPNYEVILVDDGSTDETQEIAQAFPEVRFISQENRGLSAARNVGIVEATGEIVAFTDSDCMADEDWLYHLVGALLRSSDAGVGGPNLSPPATNWVQATVAAAPGSPSHVLLSDTEAEHIPGCNMAFHRWALEAIGGFDVEYRRAGDDVDVCWRLIQQGHSIGFSPAAIVWHYRRFTVAAYFHQQRGYGEAESLLRFKHLQYFGPTGSALWQGHVYSQTRLDPLFFQPIIYHGVFGTGFFQCLYPRPLSPWAGLLSSIEWLALFLFIFLVSIPLPGLRLLPLILFGLTLWVGLHYVCRACLEAQHDSLLSRLLLFYLATVQPWVRGGARYWAWIHRKRTPSGALRSIQDSLNPPLTLREAGSLPFWSEEGCERTALLKAIQEELEAEGWKFALDTGWKQWDLHVFVSRWWSLRLCTLTEIYPHGKRLTRVSNRLHMNTLSLIVMGLMATVALVVGLAAPKTMLWGGSLVVFISAIGLGRGLFLRRRLAQTIRIAAQKLGLQWMRASSSP